ncbi:unnamed protein product, partial [Heterosigma akashiwo]
TQRNQYILTRILAALFWLGCQGLAIRGLKDERSNFITLLWMMAMSDSVLKLHLETTKGTKKSYISHRIQNEFINLMGGAILAALLTEIKASPFWAVLGDEGTDSAHKTQMAIFIRYWVRSAVVDWQIKESFVGFVHCPNTAGVALKTALVLYLRDKPGLDMVRFRAQGYDGGGNMAECNIGLQKLMTDMYPLCVYFHCLCHCLNLAINSTCQLPTIATFISTMTTLTLAFKMLPKRQHFLAQELKDPRCNHSDEIGNQEKVATFCETRWTQRSDSMTTFKSAL